MAGIFNYLSLLPSLRIKACRLMSAKVPHFWPGLSALLRGHGTAPLEGTARRGIDGRGQLALQLDPGPGLGHVRIRNGNCRQKGLCIRMDRMLVYLVRRPLLHQMAQIHDADPMGNIVDHAQIMGHEQVGDPQLVLYLL